MTKQTENKRVFIIGPTKEQVFLELLGQMCELWGFDVMLHDGLEGASLDAIEFQPHIGVIRIKRKFIDEYIDFGKWCHASDAIGPIFLIGVINPGSDHGSPERGIALEAGFDKEIYLPFILDEFERILLQKDHHE